MKIIIKILKMITYQWVVLLVSQIVKCLSTWLEKQKAKKQKKRGK